MIAGLLQSLGLGGGTSTWVGAAASLLLALVLALATFIILGVVRNRCDPESRRYELLHAVRKPLSILVLVNGLLENLNWLVPADMQGYLASVDTLQTIVIIATLLWILLRYIGMVERRLDRAAAGDGTILLPLVRERLDRGTINLLFKALRALVGLVGLLMLFQAFGVSITGLLAFGGMGGIIVGFAARDLLSNTFSGLRIFWSRPFDVGDWIRCRGHDIEGVVEAIGWQITQIRTFDKRPLYVPNSLMADSVIENPQRMTNRRIYEFFGVRYADIKRMPALLADIRQMMDAHPDITNDLPRLAHLTRYGAYSVDFFIYCMTATTNWVEFNRVKEDVLLKVADLVFKHEADFAFPTQTLHLDHGGDPPALPPHEDEARPA